MNISYFLFGYVRIVCDYDNVTPLLNLCMRLALPYTDMLPETDGVRLTFHLSSMKTLQREAAALGIEYKTDRRGGIPCFFERYKYRFGIYVGLLVAVAMLIASRLFVWRIDVIGNESITTAHVKELLRGQGFFVGAFIPNINTDKIENQILIDSDTVSWISVNLKGNAAEVQIRERQREAKEESTRPANLVAGKSGVVEEVRILNGLVVANAGRYVNKGDLLVSGIYDSTQLPFRYTRAAGQVYARTVTEFYVEIPYEYSEMRYTGAEYYDKFLIFFDYSINISKNYRNLGGLYDKIELVENYCFHDGSPTPFYLRTVKYLEYEWVTATRSQSAAETLAYFELSERLAECASDTVILKKTVVPQITDRAFTLYCTVVAIEDIAETREFEVSDMP